MKAVVCEAGKELLTPPECEATGQDVDVLDLLLTLSLRRKLIFSTITAAATVSLMGSLLLPNYYEARTSFLPPQANQSSSSLMAGQLSAITGISTREMGLKNPSDLYVALLGSEAVGNALVERFHLKEVLGESRLSDTRTKLARRTSINAGKDGLVAVVFEDRDPKRAADIANGYVEELQHLNSRLAISEAAQRRLFFAQQLEQAKEDLLKAEIQLGNTERKTGVVEVGANAKALVEQVAILRGQMAAKEVEVRSMQAFAADQNPDYRLAIQQLTALRSQLAKLEQGTGEGASGSLGKLSGAAVEYAERLREVKYEETLFELLAKQYESARIDEAKEGSIIQVVDRAAPPEKHSWPRRSLIVIASTLLGGFVSTAWVLLEASIRRAVEDPCRVSKLARLRQSWKSAF